MSVLISLHGRWGEAKGFERLTISMQSRVPLGPGKFHVVVLVTFLYYANEDSDDVIGGSTRTIQN